jgi:hypothetical protein
MAVVGLVLFLLAQPAVSQVPDDKLIAPGQRIGKLTLSMTIAKCAESSGRPARVDAPTDTDIVPGLSEHYWPADGLRVGTSDGQNIIYIEVEMASDPNVTAQYKTRTGIGVGALPDAVTNAYGKPTMVTTPQTRRSRLIYDSIGLAVVASGGEVRRIQVFKPGTAGTIWY